MTKSELINKIHNRLSTLKHADVDMSIKVILDSLTETLAEGSRVEIRGFGSFTVTIRPPRVGRNPKTGQRVDVAQKKVPSFKPGIGLRDRLNK
ncbi:integration host factor subunit beta [Methylotenera sp.]|uniref:integration host factor subunit beta n=1 Tax=Methylotenera sp. TaxID=2051956 RepID=UPI002ED8A4B0